MNLIDTDDYAIVVVDNASPNCTGKIIEDELKNKKNCYTIINPFNLGFAKGNNVGYKFAKENLKCDFICLLNNDTYLIQNDFFKCILNDYRLFGFYVAGPMILTPNINDHPNPMGKHAMIYQECKKKILSLYSQLILNRSILDEVCRKIVHQIRNNKYGEKSSIDYTQYQLNVKLHGSCLILSPKYVNQYDGLNSDTFLYLEEDLLFITMMKSEQLTLYSPKIKIFHKEDGSTDYLFNKEREKRYFILKQHLKSMIVIKKYLKQFL
jgi:GT2 family glycosyltransferase